MPDGPQPDAGPQPVAVAAGPPPAVPAVRPEPVDLDALTDRVARRLAHRDRLDRERRGR
ncbi:hypothetical protein CLV67_11663 [Actinoplanes italicus]|uniref:Uncharacterized protein n=2 Tax=Actinoplanes italicus TaxID=113567 RepID=A0A2T0K3M9_9ACTN|nr:hypothetical protein CLV67_11663 [Actinoplanes italicus]